MIISPSHPCYIGVAKHTPLGPVWVGTTHRGLAAVQIGGQALQLKQGITVRLGDQALQEAIPTSEAIRQIKEYLNGERQQFDLAIDWTGMTPFQQTVLKMVATIPYGQVSTYGQVARRIGKPGAARAVGRANATNPIPLVLPCHRIIGADGRLRGYGAPGGLTTKAWLLNLEKGRLP